MHILLTLNLPASAFSWHPILLLMRHCLQISHSFINICHIFPQLFFTWNSFHSCVSAFALLCAWLNLLNYPGLWNDCYFTALGTCGFVLMGRKNIKNNNNKKHGIDRSELSSSPVISGSYANIAASVSLVWHSVIKFFRIGQKSPKPKIGHKNRHKEQAKSIFKWRWYGLWNVKEKKKEKKDVHFWKLY